MTHATPFPPFRRWLAARSDGFLADVLRNRPDALSPPPRSSDALAGRLQVRSSVHRALADLDALELGVLEAAIDLGGDAEPVRAADVVDELRSSLAAAGVPAKDRPTIAHAREALDGLRSRALIHGDGPGGAGAFSGRSTRKSADDWEDHLMVADEAVAALPPGWRLIPRPGEPSVAELRSALDAADERQKKLLGTLAEAGGLGTTRDASEDADPSLPVPRLIAAGLLTRVDAGHVRLPRVVARLLRGQGPALRALTPSARVRGEAFVDPDAPRRADEAGAGQGLEITRRMSRLLDHLGVAPVALNRDATVGVRAAANLAKELGDPVAEIHRLVSLGVAAGLIGRGEIMAVEAREGAQFLAPTRAAAEWLAEPLAAQWARLLHGWWASPFGPWRVGGVDDSGQPVRLLSDASRSDLLPRRRVLATAPYVQATAGVSLDREEWHEDQHFLFPVAAAAAPDEEQRVLAEEARWIGAVAVGAATTWLRLLHRGAGAAIAAAVAAITPPEVEQVIVQSDMTVLVPGPLPRQLQAELELMAELESPGLASMYRISEDSLRRALDAGRSAADLDAWFRRHTLGEIPQALSYLVAEVARRHGGLRGGAVASYLRTGDPLLLDTVFATPTATAAGLRRLAPTVAVSARRLAEVLAELRAGGHHAVAEDESGAALDLRPDPLTVPAERMRAQVQTTVADSQVEAALRALRREENTAGAPAELRVVPGSESLSTLQAAARGGKTVTLGIVDKHGRAVEATVKPVTVTGGRVDAVDERHGTVQRFLLHRITHVIVE